MNWKDSTSYCQRDKERKPTTWTTEVGGLRITVTSGHIYYPGKWVMHCHEAGMDTVPVNAVNAETAQIMAVELVREKVEKWYEALQASNRKPARVKTAKTKPNCAPVTGSETVRVELKMRVLEYHTFEREVNKADFEHHRKHGDVTSWLDEQFKDDPMPDSDISTESFELDEWKLLRMQNSEIRRGDLNAPNNPQSESPSPASNG